MKNQNLTRGGSDSWGVDWHGDFSLDIVVGFRRWEVLSGLGFEQGESVGSMLVSADKIDDGDGGSGFG